MSFRADSLFIKTIFIILLLLLLPIIVFTLLAVTIITKEFPIISQKRGRYLGDKMITLYKIRTIVNTKSFKALENNSRSIVDKRTYKNHVPLFCRLLRKSGFDEILQLVNIVKGDMCLIGPRPLTTSDLIILKQSEPKLHDIRMKLNCKPGLTGYWQVYGDRDKGLKNLVDLDQYYDRNKSLFLNIKIILKTLSIVLSFRHSDAILFQGKSDFKHKSPFNYFSKLTRISCKNS